MKESVGSVATIYIIIFFIMIMFGFISSVLSYYKSYKINNSLASIIEDNGGYNKVSKKKVDRKLKAYGYNLDRQVTCRKSTGSNEKFFDENANDVVNNDSVKRKGYCVSVVDESGDGTYKYYSYKISTYLILNFGIFSFKFPYKISSRTNTMYGCFGINCE